MRNTTTLFMCLGLLACDASREPTTTRTSVKTSSHVLAASDLDLGAVVAAIKAGRVGNAKELQDLINDPATGINDVDVNGDKEVDYITVRDAPDGSLDLTVAQESQDPLTVANIKIDQTTNSVSGGYPSYVQGYQRHHYHDRFSVGDALFMMWMMDATRPRFYGTMPASHVTRTVYTTQQRSAVRSSNGLARTAPTARPLTYRVKSATPVRARNLAQAAKSKSVGDMKGKLGGSFKPPSTTTPVKKTWSGPTRTSPSKKTWGQRRTSGGGSRRSRGRSYGTSRSSRRSR